MESGAMGRDECAEEEDTHSSDPDRGDQVGKRDE